MADTSGSILMMRAEMKGDTPWYTECLGELVMCQDCVYWHPGNEDSFPNFYSPSCPRGCIKRAIASDYCSYGSKREE